LKPKLKFLLRKCSWRLFLDLSGTPTGTPYSWVLLRNATPHLIC